MDVSGGPFEAFTNSSQGGGPNQLPDPANGGRQGNKSDGQTQSLALETEKGNQGGQKAPMPGCPVQSTARHAARSAIPDQGVPGLAGCAGCTDANESEMKGYDQVWPAWNQPPKEKRRRFSLL